MSKTQLFLGLTGRINRKQYWIGMLVLIVVSMAINAVILIMAFQSAGYVPSLKNIDQIITPGLFIALIIARLAYTFVEFALISKRENDCTENKLVRMIFLAASMNTLRLMVVGESVIAGSWVSIIPMICVIYIGFRRGKQSESVRDRFQHISTDDIFTGETRYANNKKMSLGKTLFSLDGRISRKRYLVFVILILVSEIVLQPRLAGILGMIVLPHDLAFLKTDTGMFYVFLLAWAPIDLLFLYIKISLVTKRFADAGQLQNLVWLVIAANLYNLIFKGMLFYDGLPIVYSFYRFLEMPILIFAGILGGPPGPKRHQDFNPISRLGGDFANTVNSRQQVRAR